MADIYHVIPTGDLVEHKESHLCWCNPRVEEDGKLIVHNSADVREDIEREVAKMMANDYEG